MRSVARLACLLVLAPVACAPARAAAPTHEPDDEAIDADHDAALVQTDPTGDLYDDHPRPSDGAKAAASPWRVVLAIDLDDDGVADLEERQHQCGCYSIFSETRIKRAGSWAIASRTLQAALGVPRLDRCDLR